MIQTRYSNIKAKGDYIEAETYKGVWNNSSCEFKRNFRGYRLSDEECIALCNGEKIEIHNLQNKYASTYAVSCRLSLKNNIFGELGVIIDVIDTVPNNPNHKYGDKLYNSNPYSVPVSVDTDDEIIYLNDDDLDGINTEDEVLKYRESTSKIREDIHHENINLKNMIKSMIKTKPVEVNDDNSDDEEDTDNEIEDIGDAQAVNTESVEIKPVKIETDLIYNADDEVF